MKNKKGFTLIELLAVIVILAIIALIAIPIVLNMIEQARKSAARSAALGYIDAIEYNNGFASLESDAEVSGYTKITSGNVSEITSTLGSHLKGKAPTSGSVVIDANGKVESATDLCFNGYAVQYDGKDARVEGKCSSSESSSNTKKLTVGEKVKFNPIKYDFCDDNDTSASCYNWIVISKNNNTYELFMLDNSETVRWNSSKPNPVDMIKSYTGLWSDKLTVDSSHDYTYSDDWKFEFSSTKARMFSVEEFNELATDIQNEIKTTCNVGGACAVTNNTENYVGQINPGGTFNTVPYIAKSILSQSFLKPVIKVDTTNTSSTPFGGEIVSPTSTDTHKGIVYMDPTNLKTKCTESTSSIGSGKTGCLKFYVFDISSTKYKLLLDHNTTGRIAWVTQTDYTNAGGTEWNNKKNGKGGLTVNAQLEEDTKNWEGNTRLIKADEIAHIVGTDKDSTLKWKQSNTFGTTVGSQSSYFYFDGSGSTYSGWQNQIADSTTKSKYAWLYDYTDCSDYGCNHSDSNSGGYWTDDDAIGRYDDAWGVSQNGKMDIYAVTQETYLGVRPVIEIEKSKIQ